VDVECHGVFSCLVGGWDTSQVSDAYRQSVGEWIEEVRADWELGSTSIIERKTKESATGGG
jgi:hypothetical protein